MTTFLQSVENISSQLISKPTILIDPPPELISGLTSVLKEIYHETVKYNSLTGVKTRALPSLLVDGFEDEAIWAQIEIQNKDALPHLKNLFYSSPTSLLEVQDSEDEIPNKKAMKRKHQDFLSNEVEDQSREAEKEKSQDSLSNEADENRMAKEEELQDPLSNKDDENRKSSIDTCEDFLNAPVSSDCDENEEMDEDESSFESEEELDGLSKKLKKSARDLMYEDFFDAPTSNENLDPNNEDGESLPTKVAGSPIKIKTPFEIELEKIQQQCENYEQNILKPAPWHLTGEVEAIKRPKDALLHLLHLDFEMNSRPTVVEDKSLNEKLESLLKNAIKNKAFNDPVRQYKTNDEIIAKKKETFIEDTKSKKGLAQEYEDMYLKKKHGEIEEKNPKHVEIEKLMDSLFPQLYALFSHIPKPAVPDITVVSNLPAITVEDVAPTSVSDVTLLAPEEVKKRTGVIKGKTERTDVDRKRERRKKKLLQKEKQKKREKEIGEKPLSAKAKKQEKVDLIKKLRQQRNTKFAKVDGQKVKSSKDFFERLQETVSNTEGKKKKAKKT